MTAPEPYSYTLAPRAQRDLAAMPLGAAMACAAFIAERIVQNPWRISGPLSGRWAGCRSSHVEAYRVIFTIDEERHRVRVIHVGPRGTVYNA